MRIALGVEYDGSNYCGWQRQPGYVTIQADLEAALSRVADAPVLLCCAGRTDSGVHATGQVVHFDTSALRRESAWVLGANRYLPSAIKIRWARLVPSHFHARFSALARHYRYVIDNSPWCPAVLSQGITYFPRPLNAKAMHHASQFLVGEHDFTSFRALQCQSRSPWRHMMQLNVVRQGNYVIVNLQANAFVHHMARNIVGTLLQVGCGRESPDWVATLLALRDRTQAAATAKAQGLYLVKVDYPLLFDLPVTPRGPLFLTD